MYTVQELADVLRMSYTGVLKLVKENKIKAIKVGKVWRISQEEYDRVIREGA